MGQGQDPKNPVFQFVPISNLTLSVRNGPIVSFGTNVPLNIMFS